MGELGWWVLVHSVLPSTHAAPTLTLVCCNLVCFCRVVATGICICFDVQVQKPEKLLLVLLLLVFFFFL
jgi:hypothetical protein